MRQHSPGWDGTKRSFRLLRQTRRFHDGLPPFAAAQGRRHGRMAPRRPAASRREFEILRGTRISSAWAEDAAIRLHCLESEHPSVLLPVFLGVIPDSSAVEFLSALGSRKKLADPALSYLLVLALSRQGETDRPIAQLARARFTDPVLRIRVLPSDRPRRICDGEVPESEGAFLGSMQLCVIGGS